MADAFKLLGSYEAAPLASPLSFAPTVIAQINEARSVKAKQVSDVSLDADAPVTVDFGGITSAHIVILKSTLGKVRARLTSADGSQQAVPFDTYLILMSESVPVTALDLTRVPGTPTVVRVFLAEKV